MPSNAQVGKRARKCGNLGQTGLRRRKRRSDPMRDYDSLPPALRSWLQQAVLPWSPHSCRRIWTTALQTGATQAEALAQLDRLEAATLNRARAA